MHPFGSKWKWVASNRFQHAVAFVEQLPDAYETPMGAVLKDRITMMRRWIRVRTFVLVVLILNAAATAVAYIFQAIQQEAGGQVAAEAARGLARAMEVLVEVAGSLAGLSALAWLLVNRTLGQLEVDVFGILTTRALSGDPAPK